MAQLSEIEKRIRQLNMTPISPNLSRRYRRQFDSNKSISNERILDKESVHLGHARTSSFTIQPKKTTTIKKKDSIEPFRSTRVFPIGPRTTAQPKSQVQLVDREKFLLEVRSGIKLKSAPQRK